jgi:hypothetical protein
MQHDAHQSPPAWISTYAPSTALDADMSRGCASVRRFHRCRAGCLTIGGGPQPSRYRAIRHKSLRLLSLAQCFPASWPNRLFRRTCSGPIHKPPSSFRPSGCRNFSTQMGVRAATTAVAARLFARVSAAPAVTQPPQLNPTIARAIAPAAAPHSTERRAYSFAPALVP